MFYGWTLMKDEYEDVGSTDRRDLMSDLMLARDRQDWWTHQEWTRNPELQMGVRHGCKRFECASNCV